MTWQDTVMSQEQLEKAESDYLAEDFSVNAIRLNRGHTEDLRLRIAQAQAKLAWAAREPEIAEARKAGYNQALQDIRDGLITPEVWGEDDAGE